MPDSAPRSAGPVEVGRLRSTLLEFKQEILLGRDALVRFDLTAMEQAFARQQQLCLEIAAALSVVRACHHCPEWPEMSDLLRELGALNRQQSALVTGGQRAVRLELNLAELASPDGNQVFDE